MDYYVYAHVRSDTGTVFYIGKGKNGRVTFEPNRSEYWKRIAKKHGYTHFFIAKDLTEEDAYQLEIDSIALCKKLGYCEANFTEGGDGVKIPAGKRWWNKQISESLVGTTKPRGKDSKHYVDFASKDELAKLYIGDGMSSIKIGELYGVSAACVCKRLEEFGISKRKPAQPNKKIVCNETGKVYDSIADASRDTGLYRENIRKVLYGKYKHTGHLTFKFI